MCRAFTRAERGGGGYIKLCLQAVAVAKSQFLASVLKFLVSVVCAVGSGWMAGWLDGWMAGWLDGWMAGWLVGGINPGLDWMGVCKQVDIRTTKQASWRGRFTKWIQHYTQLCGETHNESVDRGQRFVGDCASGMS